MRSVNADYASSSTRPDAAAHPSEGELAQLTLESIGDAIVSTDLAGRIIYLNSMAESMTGRSRQEAYGRPLDEVLQVIDGVGRELMTNPLEIGPRANRVLIDLSGREVAIEATTAPIRDRNGQRTGSVMVFHDVSATRALTLKMSHLAHHDFLTGLPNRLLLSERLAQTISSAQRHRKALAVMFLDMDGFKHINDSLGHAVGDGLLKSIARRLMACVRGSDTVSRQGGDEFVVLLAEMTAPQDAGSIAGKIVADSKLPHSVGSHTIAVTASIGIGLYPADGTDAETLLKNADLALLHAKAAGGGAYRFFGD